MSGNKMALIMSLICALIASFLVYRIIKQSANPKVVEIPKVEVVFAKTAIPARSEINATQLEVRKIPKEGANSNALSNISDAVGRVTKSEILQGEILLKERLLQKGQKYSMSFLIPEGMRAITVAIDEIKGVAGFVKPGERVDVVGTFEFEAVKGRTSWTLVQDAEVLAVAQDMGEPVKAEKDAKKDAAEKSKPKVSTSITLAVTPQQAQQLALGEELGVLRVVLRPLLRDTMENQAKLVPLPETALLPKLRSGLRISNSRAAAVVAPRQERRIEVISGGKSQYITVD